MSLMQVLAVSSEIYPLIKTGGLADVVGALPGAISEYGVTVRTLVPGYAEVLHNLEDAEIVRRYPSLMGCQARVLSGRAGGLELFVLDAPGHFHRNGGPYTDEKGVEYPDNWARFSALSIAGADIAGKGAKGWKPDLVHVHDWQAAMCLAYMRFGAAAKIPKVITIHNLAFQGRFPAEIFPDLKLPSEAWNVDGVEYYGGVGFLKAGLVSADAITTVSPRYAAEIRTPQNGMGLDGLLNGRADRLFGVLNGIDTDIWNPETDVYLENSFSYRSLAGRKQNRRVIEGRLRLDEDQSPLFILISRLTWQKGVDVLIDVLDDVVAAGAKIAVLGSGDQALEGAFLAATDRHQGRVGFQVGYDEPFSHILQGGGDAILVPSRFEPCGLTQLYGLRYGCVPVVADVGGLSDTIIDANEAAISTGCATGVKFAPLERRVLLSAIIKTISLRERKPVWTAMQRAGMKSDFSWRKSAQHYAQIFGELVSETG